MKSTWLSMTILLACIAGACTTDEEGAGATAAPPPNGTNGTGDLEAARAGTRGRPTARPMPRSRSSNVDERLTALPVAGRDGEVIVGLANNASGSRTALVQKWNRAGDVVWQLDGGWQATTLDADGNVVVVAEPYDALGGSTNPTTVRAFDAAKAEVWTKPLPKQIGESSAVFDPTGYVVLAGADLRDGENSIGGIQVRKIRR